jgi:hypothetical protein
MKVDWKTIIKNGGLVMCSEAEAKALKILPNRLGFAKDNPRLGALIAFQHDNGLWPVSVNGMNLAKAKLEAGEFDSMDVLQLRSEDSLELVPFPFKTH